MNSEDTNRTARRTVVALAGDGVGSEITDSACAVLADAADLHGIDLVIEPAPFGISAFETTGAHFPQETRNRCATADAVFLGAVERHGLLELRREFDFFANLRPVKSWPQLSGLSSLRDEIAGGVDILFVRELTAGIHFGPSGRGADEGGAFGYHTMLYHDREVRRIADVALRLAASRRARVTVAHKENALPCIPWCEIVHEQAAAFAEVEVEVEELLVDTLSMELIRDPSRFDVVLSGNLIGDWLSSLGAALIGSIGLLPSASLNADGFGLFEPIHGTAPELAGRDLANPIGAMLSAAMMLENFGERAAAACIRDAIVRTIDDGFVTADIAAPGRSAIGTRAMTEAILTRMEKHPE